MMRLYPFLCRLLPGALLLLGCATRQVPESTDMPVTLDFGAQINGEPFDCQRQYTQVGRTAATLTPRDFRFYVSGIHLINAAGESIPLRLTQDGIWQQENVALLDFEDQSGSCEGNVAVRQVVTGTLPGGVYRGIRFDLGVPFSLNHQDANRASSPLNLTSLFWAWQSGYKFARLDFATEQLPQGYFIHLGSTGCLSDDASGISKRATTPPLKCSQPNRPQISLAGFEPGNHQIIADLGQLLANSDLKSNAPQTPGGCMSGSDDSDCEPLFSQLGLPFNGQPGNSQQFFRLASP